MKRIRAEMEKVKAEVGFKGDLKAFFAYLKTDPKFLPLQNGRGGAGRLPRHSGHASTPT